jgi:ABC-2 type transport system ATP-binding protein
MYMTEALVPLDVQHVCKQFNKKTVLDDITLTLDHGEIFGLIGLNGIGKTTLIKIILDLIVADGGAVSIYGASALHERARNTLVYLPEKFQPSRYLKGREYLELSVSYYGKSYDHARAVAEAEALALDVAALDRRVASYSKGMGQKLGLIGALMADTPLLILDEPMSGLDPRARVMLKDRLKLLKDEGRTLFFSSHILADIDEICDRIGILHQSMLQFVGTPQAFRQLHQDSSLERAFLESINAIDAQLLAQRSTVAGAA